jgi:NAD(P)-dependent dehydrogenase (short-subunit alcohol dehydrogenase family)
MNPTRVALLTGDNRGMGLETCRELATSADAKHSGGYFCKHELTDW